MSILNFSEDKYIKTFDADEEIRMGGIDLAAGKGGPLSNIRVLCYVNSFASLSGNEQMTMKIYTSSKYSNAYITSSVLNVSDIVFDSSDPSKPNYLGYVRFDFNREFLNENNTYFPTVTVSNFTPSGNTFYMGLAYDYPDPIYDNGGAFFFNQSIAMQVFTYNQRTV